MHVLKIKSIGIYCDVESASNACFAKDVNSLIFLLKSIKIVTASYHYLILEFPVNFTINLQAMNDLDGNSFTITILSEYHCLCIEYIE